MSRYMLLAIFLIMALPLYAGENKIEIKTDRGTFEVRISQNNENVSATMLSIPENVRDRLIRDIRDLRNEYISRLYSRKDRQEAMEMLDEMEDLINMMYRLGFTEQSDENSQNTDINEEQVPIDPTSFNTLLTQLKEESFSDNKLDILRSAVKDNYFTVAQLCEIMSKFDMDDDKVEAVRIVYPHVIDTENSYKLLSKVTFSDSKKKIKDIIDNKE